jgi:hypothetical protein
MLDRDTVIRAPHSKNDERVSIKILDEGVALTLFFAPAATPALAAEGPVVEARIESGNAEPLQAWRLLPRFPLYQQYARAAVAWRDDDVRAALLALRQAGPTRRGLPDDLYRKVATIYGGLVDEGERYPIKRLAQGQNVDISTASRWVKGARDRGYLPEKVSA